MKKKLLTLLMCVVSAMALCFGVAACGDDNKKSDNPTELSQLKSTYGQKLVAHAKTASGFPAGIVTYNCVVLGREDTVAALEHYTFLPEVDAEQVVGGIFVQVTSSELNIAINMLYGLEFNAEAATDYSVTLVTNPSEQFTFERVNGNAKIVFEYEAVQE